MKIQSLVLFATLSSTNLHGMEPQSIEQKSNIVKQKKLNDALYHAVSDENTEDVTRLLKLGANPDATCPESAKGKPLSLPGSTALMCAAYRGNTAICELLLYAGANPILRTTQKRNALLHAIIKCRRFASELLLWHTKPDQLTFFDLKEVIGQEKYYLSSQSRTHAVNHYLDAASEFCLKEKIHLTQADENGMTLLHYLAHWGSPDLCSELIRTRYSIGATLDPRNNDNETPLHLAAYWHHSKQSEDMLAHGADPNAISTKGIALNPDWRTPLAYALTFSLGLEERYELTALITHGADVNTKARTHDGYNFLDLVARGNKRSLSAVVLAPREIWLHFTGARKRIKTFLLCCKRLCPQLPKDMRSMLLMMIPNDDLGILMIFQKLHGRSIPSIFHDAAVTTLYNTTLPELKRAIAKHVYLREYKHRDPLSITDKNFEEKYGELLRQNIIARLAQPKLLCNNPSEVNLIIDKN